MKTKKFVSLLLIATMLAPTATFADRIQARRVTAPPAGVAGIKARKDAGKCTAQDAATLGQIGQEMLNDFNAACTTVDRAACDPSKASCDDSTRFPLLQSAVTNKELIQTATGVEAVHCGNYDRVRSRFDIYTAACIRESELVDDVLAQQAGRDCPGGNCGQAPTTLPEGTTQAAGTLALINEAAGGSDPNANSCPAGHTKSSFMPGCFNKDTLKCALKTVAPFPFNTSEGCSSTPRAGAGVSCVLNAAKGFLDGLVFNIKGLFVDLPVMAFNGVRSLFRGSAPAETKAADSGHFLSRMSTAELAQVRADKGKGLITKISDGLAAFMDMGMTHMTCDKWKSVPFVSECEHSTSTSWSCATCGEKTQALCAGAPWLVAQFTGLGFAFGIVRGTGLVQAAFKSRFVAGLARGGGRLASQASAASAAMKTALPGLTRVTAAAGRGARNVARVARAGYERTTSLLAKNREFRAVGKTYLQRSRDAQIARSGNNVLSRTTAYYKGVRNFGRTEGAARAVALVASNTGAAAVRGLAATGRGLMRMFDEGDKIGLQWADGIVAGTKATGRGATQIFRGAASDAAAVSAIRRAAGATERMTAAGKLGDAAQGLATEARGADAGLIVTDPVRATEGLTEASVVGPNVVDDAATADLRVNLDRRDYNSAVGRTDEVPGVEARRTGDATDETQLGINCPKTGPGV